MLDEQILLAFRRPHEQALEDVVVVVIKVLALHEVNLVAETGVSYRQVLEDFGDETDGRHLLVTSRAAREDLGEEALESGQQGALFLEGRIE